MPVEADVVTSSSTAPRRKTRSRAERRVRLGLTVAVVVIITLALRPALEEGVAPEDLTGRFGWWAPVLSILVMSLLSWTFLPSEVVAVAHGAAYGLVGGSLANVAAWTIAGGLQYVVSYYSFGMGTAAEMQERLPKWLRRWPVDSTIFLILAHQVPFGSKAVSTIAPSIGLSWRRRMMIGLVGLAPFAAITASIGAGGF